MNTEQDRNQGRTLRRWIAMLAVPLFLTGTALFSFLWNVPLDKLAAPRRADASPAVLLREASSPAVRTVPNHPSLEPAILSMLRHYTETISNAGHLDFTSHAPQEVEIRMDGLSISLGPSLAVFNFETRYGLRMQTSRKPDAADRAVYQWLKDTMQPEEPAEPETALTQPSNGTGAALSNPSSCRKSCGTERSSAREPDAPGPEDDSLQRL